MLAAVSGPLAHKTELEEETLPLPLCCISIPDSDHSSAETLLQPGVGNSDTYTSDTTPRRRLSGSSFKSSTTRHSPDPPGHQHGPLPRQLQLQARKGQGYRKLWQMVSRVQRGERLSESGAAKEDVTVEDLVKTVQQLPASVSAIEAITSGLAYIDSRAAAALLKSLSKAGMGHRAVEIFDYLRTLDPDHELYSLCDIFTYTTMISQCNSHHQLRRALELVAEMRSRAVPLNVHTYSALLNVCLKANELDLSMDVYEQMLADGCTPNLVTYNTLLDIYNKTGRWMDALNVLELLQHQTIKPEARTYNAIITTCNNAGHYAEAVNVYKIMCAAGVEPNGATYNIALTSYARSGQLEAALALFSMMGAKGYERGANTYAAVLSSCETPGRWDLALELLQQMQMEGVRPSTACLTSAISACMHGGQPQRAKQLFERMYTMCKPDASTFNCLVCIYCRLGKHQGAVNMLEVMLRGGQHVDLTTYDAAVGACWATGVVPLQKYALQLYERAHQQGLYQIITNEQAHSEGYVLDVQLPSGPPYVVLLSLLRALRQLRDEYVDTMSTGTVGKVLIRLAVQGQDMESLNTILSNQLRSLGSPFIIMPQVAAAPVIEIHFAANSLATAQWLKGPAVAAVLGLLGLVGTSAGLAVTGRGVDGMLTSQEDMQREVNCRQALLSIQTYEAACQINVQNIPQALLVQRGELVQLLLHSASCLGLSAELAHDAIQLMDRASATGLATSIAGRLLAAACMHIVAQQDPTGPSLLAVLFQVAPQQLLIAVTAVRQVLGSSSCIAVSAMRVLRLLLERLGVESHDATTSSHVCGQALSVMSKIAMSPLLLGCPPSVVAVAVLYACRMAAGLLPAWPVTLVTLTGYAETNAMLQPYIKAVLQLVLEV